MTDPRLTHLDAAETAALFAAALEGTLDEASHAQLADLLLNDPDARAAYLRLMNLHGLLQWQQAQMTSPPAAQTTLPAPVMPRDVEPVPPRAPQLRNRRISVMRWAIAAAIVLCIGVAYLVMQSVSSNPQPTSPGHAPIALLSNSVNARWGESTVPTALGAELSTGTLDLVAGSAQIMFHSGAVVDLIAPCRFELTDANHGYLHRGRISAYVPERARGFTVDFLHTDHVIDLGTEFTLTVDSDRAARVWVHQGTIELVTADQHHTLAAGYGLAMSDGAVQPLNTPLARVDSASLGRIAQFRLGHVKAYSGQDGQNGSPTHFDIEDDGRTIHLVGNVWKMIDLPYDVTRDTVIEFEFKAGREGEIHAIGFDAPGPAYGVVQFYGTEHRASVPRIKQLTDAGNWVKVRVPIGRYYHGHFQRLLLANDDDAHGAAESWFRNVRVFTPAPTDDGDDNAAIPLQKETQER